MSLVKSRKPWTPRERKTVLDYFKQNIDKTAKQNFQDLVGLLQGRTYDSIKFEWNANMLPRLKRHANWDNNKVVQINAKQDETQATFDPQPTQVTTERKTYRNGKEIWSDEEKALLIQYMTQKPEKWTDTQTLDLIFEHKVFPGRTRSSIGSRWSVEKAALNRKNRP